MTGRSASNCTTNHSRNGYRFYRFPADPERRKKWLIRRRQDWNPMQNDRLCSVMAHFEESQIEQHHVDGRKLLLPFAVPTIFNVSNPPKLLNVSRKSAYKTNLNNMDTKRIKLDEPCATDTRSAEGSALQDDNKDTASEVSELKKTIAKLEEQLKLLRQALAKLLTPEQIEHLQVERKYIRKWKPEDVVKSLKLRFALGKNGYNFLRETGYPAPTVY